MEDSEESVQNIYIELELIIDIYSLLFSIIRINLINKHNIFIINKDITYLYGKNLKQGVIDLLRYVGNGSISEKEIDAFIIDVIKSFVETFSSTLKPTVPSIHVIRELRKNKNLTLSSFTHFDIDDLQGIMKDEFIDMFEWIYPFNEFLNYIASINKEQSLIVFGSRNKFNEIKSVISEENISFINVKLPMEVDETSLIQEYKSLDLIPFENYGLLKLSPLFEGTLHKFDLNKDLNTPELQFWDKTVSIEGILLTGKVVHGFQRGSKQLGVPTSNIEMTKENIDLINKLLPGVYSGISYFINSKVKYLYFIFFLIIIKSYIVT